MSGTATTGTSADGAPERAPEPTGSTPECVVLDLPPREPGFHTHGFRTFYVATDGGVYLVRSPGLRATLQPLDDLPHGSQAGGVLVDQALHHLAAAAEAVARPLGRREMQPWPGPDDLPERTPA